MVGDVSIIFFDVINMLSQFQRGAPSLPSPSAVSEAKLFPLLCFSNDHKNGTVDGFAAPA